MLSLIVSFELLQPSCHLEPVWMFSSELSHQHHNTSPSAETPHAGWFFARLDHFMNERENVFLLTWPLSACLD